MTINDSPFSITSDTRIIVIETNTLFYYSTTSPHSAMDMYTKFDSVPTNSNTESWSVDLLRVEGLSIMTFTTSCVAHMNHCYNMRKHTATQHVMIPPSLP